MNSTYLTINEFNIDNVLWIDEIDGLLSATNYIKGCKVIGVDCEWKPNYVKGSKPNKVRNHFNFSILINIFCVSSYIITKCCL